MPFYEYVCQKCSHPFEELVYGDERPACPKCKAAEVEKVLSVFAVGRSDASSGAPMGCGAGACGMPGMGGGGGGGGCGMGGGGCGMN